MQNLTDYYYAAHIQEVEVIFHILGAKSLHKLLGVILHGRFLIPHHVFAYQSSYYVRNDIYKYFMHIGL
jgi:hypothetical protein